MKIGSLIFGSLLKIGGYQIFTYNLLKRLAQRGHDVDLYVTDREYRSHTAFYQSLVFNTRPLMWRSYGFAMHAPKILGAYLRRQQRRENYDVWQVVGAYPAGFISSALAGKVPLVLRTHGDDIQKDERLNYGLRLDPRLELMIGEACRKMDRVVAMNESMADCYRELHVPESHIVEIPNGVDVDLLKAPIDRVNMREKNDLPNGMPVILTVGRYHPKKGYDIIPSVARKLKEMGFKFLWLIVGGQTERLRPLIDQKEVADSVRTVAEIGAVQTPGQSDFQLPNAELVALYQCADIFFFPSYIEGFPRVIIEAMAAGLPVVTTDAPGCRDVVKHGVNGLLTEPDDVDGMVGHLAALISDGALKHRLVGQGFGHIARYDWDTVVDQYETLYASLIT